MATFLVERRRRLHVATAVTAVLLVAALAAPAIGFNPQPEPPPHAGPFTLTEHELAQLNVVNIGDTRCDVAVNLDTLAGQTVHRSVGELAPGQGRADVFGPRQPADASGELSEGGNPPNDSRSRRTTYYTWYTWTPVGGEGACHLAASVEVVAGDGSTRFVIPGSELMFNPQPEPPAEDR